MRRLLFICLTYFLSLTFVAHGKVNLIGQITNPLELKSGDKIAIRYTESVYNGNQPSYRFLGSAGDSLIWRELPESFTHPTIVFVLESAGGMYEGFPYYYLKNEVTGKYLVYDPNMGIRGMKNYRLVYADDKKNASQFVVYSRSVPDYSQDKVTWVNHLFLLTQCKECLEYRSFLCLDFSKENPYVSSYISSNGTIQVYRTVSEVDYIEDLKFLYEQVANLHFVSGNDWGDYDVGLVTAFNDCRENAKILIAQEEADLLECEHAYNALKKAWDDLIFSGCKQLTPGYYRVVSGYSNFKDLQGVEMAMYATNKGDVKWKTYDQNEPTMGWEFIKHSDGSWRMKNLGTQQYISESNGISTKYVTGRDSVARIVNISLLENGDFNIALENALPMHTAGHSHGLGKEGDVVEYAGGTLTGSSWYLRPLDADTAQAFINIGLRETEFYLQKAELELLVNKAQDKYRRGCNVTIDTLPEHWLVTLDDYKTDSMVVFSNADHNTLNPNHKDGLGYEGLLDADTVMGMNAIGQYEKTFWHSNWGEAVDVGQPYLQFKLNKAVESFAVSILRRRNISQATEIYFQVTNDTTSGEWVDVGAITGLPASIYSYDDASLAYQSDMFELGGKYQYVRVTWKSENGFTHFAGFHFQDAKIESNSLIYRSDIKEYATSLNRSILEARTVLKDSLSTLNDIFLAYIQLQKAYEEYEKIFPDATELKTYLQDVKDYFAMTVSENMSDGRIEIYPDPGTYKEADIQKMHSQIESVESSIRNMELNNSFSQLDIDLILRDLKGYYRDFREKQRWIQAADSEKTGVWYYISINQRFYDITGTEQDKHQTDDGYYIRRGMMYVKSLDGVVNNAELRFGTKADMLRNGITDMDYATWRFIQVNDTSYAIQNKATGLFVSCAAVRENIYSNSASLSLNPNFFTLREIGYGSFILDAYNVNGEYLYPLHAQTLGQKVVYWNNCNLDGGSCWDIYTTDCTESGVLVGDYEFPIINYDKVPSGRLLPCYFPVGLQKITDDSSLGNAAYEITQTGKMGVVLSPKENNSCLRACEPFFYIPGNNMSSASDNDSIILKLQVAMNVDFSAQKTVNGVTGSLVPSVIPEDAYLLSEGLPQSFTNEYSGDVYNNYNFVYFVPDRVVSSEIKSKSIVIPYANMSLIGSDYLLSELNRSATYLCYLGDKIGQYTDTVHFAETYTKTARIWPNAIDDDNAYEMADSLKSLREALRLNLPTSGRAYRFKNSESGLYLQSYTDGNYLTLSDSPSIESSTFYYGNDRHLTGSMMHLQLNGAAYANKSTGTEYFFREVFGKLGLMQIVSPDNSYLTGRGYYLSEESYDSGDNSYWYVEDVSDKYIPAFNVELRNYEDNGYTTLYLPVAVKLTDGMEAYVGRIEDGWLKMSKLEGDIVPPAVPVIIKGMPGNYQLLYDGYAENNISMQNDLRGIFADKSISEEMNPYTLQIVDNQLGFFKYSGNLLNAFKAYLDLPVGKQIRGVVWDDSTVTGIDELFGGNDVEIYDLSGRRVTDMKRPGVYIVNGKKLVIK